MTNSMILAVTVIGIVFLMVSVVWGAFAYLGWKAQRMLDFDVLHPGTPKALRRKFLQTEVDLAPNEKRAMIQRIVVIATVAGVIIALVVTMNVLTYRRFAVNGTLVSATVTSVTSRIVHSSGRHGGGTHTEYTYGLQAVVDGVTVNDSYNAGRLGEYKNGSVIDAYAAPSTSGAHIDLAIAKNIQNILCNTAVPVFVVGGTLIFALGLLYRDVRRGKVRLGLQQ